MTFYKEGLMEALQPVIEFISAHKESFTLSTLIYIVGALCLVKFIGKRVIRLVVSLPVLALVVFCLWQFYCLQ